VKLVLAVDQALHELTSRHPNARKGRCLGPLDATWHLLNLFGPAAGLALIAPALAKLLWRKELGAVRWWRLIGAVFAACAVVTLAGLVIFGQDGKMTTYAAMVVACALALWGAGFVSRSR
jgi:hypothetical protein